MAIDSGKMVGEFKEAAYNKPYYVYILEASGNLLVHPTLAGQNLKDKAMPAYEAVTKATPEGTWVKYQWQGKEKNAYVRKTKTGAIVGSGYYDSERTVSANPVLERFQKRTYQKRKENP